MWGGRWEGRGWGPSRQGIVLTSLSWSYNLARHDTLPHLPCAYGEGTDSQIGQGITLRIGWPTWDPSLCTHVSLLQRCRQSPGTAWHMSGMYSVTEYHPAWHHGRLGQSEDTCPSRLCLQTKAHMVPCQLHSAQRTGILFLELNGHQVPQIPKCLPMGIWLTKVMLLFPERIYHVLYELTDSQMKFLIC